MRIEREQNQLFTLHIIEGKLTSSLGEKEIKEEA